MRALRPAVDVEPAWQVLVRVRGEIVRDSLEAAVRRSMIGAHVMFASREATLVDGWRVHARMRDGVTVMIVARPGPESRSVALYVDALLDAYAPTSFTPFIPPDPRSGGSGAPALIASYTPARGVC